MRALSTLAAVIALAAVATSLASTAHAEDWSIDVGIGLPGLVIIAPVPVYVPPPPRYYHPPYYPPEYYPPGYYRPTAPDDAGYVERYDRHRDWRHRHEDANDNEDGDD